MLLKTYRERVQSRKRATADRGEPKYDELPQLADTDIRHSWDVWTDRSLGTLNRLTATSRRGALAEVTEGRCLDLTLPLGEPAPPLYDRRPLGHRVFARTRSMIEDELEHLDTQSSSQWDSLRHFSAGRHGFYGGVADWDSVAAANLGIHRWLEVGVVLRGVVVDLPAHWSAARTSVDPFDEHAVTVQELCSVVSRCNVRFQRGDLLLLRTGWLKRFRSAGGVSAETRAMPPGVGLHAGPEMARYLWDSGLFAVAADNPAVEVLPGDPKVGSLHRRCLAGLGMPFGELWDLENLADWSATNKRYACCVVSVPLHVVGGVASPANAMALV